MVRKHFNVSKIIQIYIDLKHTKMSVPDISITYGISESTLYRIVSELCMFGFLKKSGDVKNGKRVTYYSTNERAEL